MADKRKSNQKQIEGQLVTVSTGVKDGVFIYSGPTTIGEFAEAVKKPANKIISHFFMQGKMFNINHIMDEEQIMEICLEYGLDFQQQKEVNAQNFMDHVEIKDEEHELKQRPPIITVMGHVDHGKTTLVDRIRNANVAAGEAGGITQHTGAYQIVDKGGNKVTFLDTPGHEAFTAMRARGAQLTDIVVLVVAGDDGVMPQTKEAIDHTKASGVPMIVFVNKMDKQGVDVERVKAELSKVDVISEEWGGEVQFVYGSALNGDGIDKLFDAIHLQAEMLELKANPDRMPIGVVVESRIDKGRGTVATVIVQHGTLTPRDFIVAGSQYGRIRTIEDASGNILDKVLPGSPAIITGLKYTPASGDKFFAFQDEKFAKNLANEKAAEDKKQEQKIRNVFEQKDGKKVVNVIIKADVQGTAEAAKYSLAKLENEEVKINVVSATAGMIAKSDIHLAQAANAIIYGFHITVAQELLNQAKDDGVQIKTYNIIYKMIEDVEELITGMTKPKYEELVTGTAQVLKVFFYSKIGNIAGCLMEKGFMEFDSHVRVIRRDKVIHTGRVDSLQRGPDQLKKAEAGKEFGTHVHKFDDIKEGDFLEAFKMVEKKR